MRWANAFLISTVITNCASIKKPFPRRAADYGLDAPRDWKQDATRELPRFLAGSGSADDEGIQKAIAAANDVVSAALPDVEPPGGLPFQQSESVTEHSSSSSGKLQASADVLEKFSPRGTTREEIERAQQAKQAALEDLERLAREAQDRAEGKRVVASTGAPGTKGVATTPPPAKITEAEAVSVCPVNYVLIGDDCYRDPAVEAKERCPAVIRDIWSVLDSPMQRAAIERGCGPGALTQNANGKERAHRPDYTQPCPANWERSRNDDTVCVADPSYPGPCPRFARVARLPLNLKQNFAKVCFAPWAPQNGGQLPNCERDYSAACPLGWVEVSSRCYNPLITASDVLVARFDRLGFTNVAMRGLDFAAVPPEYREEYARLLNLFYPCKDRSKCASRDYSRPTCPVGWKPDQKTRFSCTGETARTRECASVEFMNPAWDEARRAAEARFCGAEYPCTGEFGDEMADVTAAGGAAG